MKKIWLAIGFGLVSVLIGLIFGGAIAGSHTLIPTLPQQIEDKINAIVFAFCLGVIPTIIIFISFFVIKIIYLFSKFIINKIKKAKSRQT